jgi:hypothetical protein
VFESAHVVHPMLRSVMALLFDTYRDAFIANASYRFRDAGQFLPQSLHNHACLADGSAAILDTLDYLHVPVGATNPITGAVIPAGTAAGARTFTVDFSSGAFPPVFNTTLATAPQNRHNINEALTPQPRVTRYGALATARYELTPSVTAYGEVNYQTNTNLEYLSAVAISNLNSVTLPANAAFNPFGVAVVNNATVGATLVYRFLEAGPRATETTNTFKRLVGGLKGKFGDTWTWDSSVLYNLAKSKNELPTGWLSQSAVNAALADTNRATALNLFTNPTRGVVPIAGPYEQHAEAVAVQPAARPSRPSVRLTALLVPTITR